MSVPEAKAIPPVPPLLSLSLYSPCTGGEVAVDGGGHNTHDETAPAVATLCNGRNGAAGKNERMPPSPPLLEFSRPALRRAYLFAVAVLVRAFALNLRMVHHSAFFVLLGQSPKHDCALILNMFQTESSLCLETTAVSCWPPCASAVCDLWEGGIVPVGMNPGH